MEKENQTTTGMTASEFFAKQGEDLHIRLLTFYNMYTNEKEKLKQLDDDILFFEFTEGRYSITYEDLKKKADEETLVFLAKHNIDQTQTPDGPIE